MWRVLSAGAATALQDGLHVGRMAGVVLGFFSLLQFALCVRALVGCLRERFGIGSAGAVARLTLMALVAAASLSSPISLIPGLHQPGIVIGWAAIATVVGAVGGPLVSLGVLAVAYLRSRNVPMADEERVGRPFSLWLPVGLLDAIYVALQIFAFWFGLGER
jgi:hypothetical protein